MKLLVIDSNSVLNRAFYGIKLLTTKDGQYTNGIYGFLNILLKIIDEVQPDAIACAFDVKHPTFRHEMYDGYKAQRKGMPEELAQQLPVLKELLTDLGYPIVELPGFEADDILGTLSRVCVEQGQECVLATGDRDSLQLVSDQVAVRLAATKMGRPESTLYDPAAIREKYGVEPLQLIEVKALMGDSSDNIPGVAGIGKKTALDLISRFGSVDAIYENLDTIDVKPGVRKKLQEGKEMAYLSRKLAEIDRHAPIDCNLEDYRLKERDVQAAYTLLSKLEMHTMIEKLGLHGTVESAAPAVNKPDEKPQITPHISPKEGQLTRLLGEERLFALFAFEGDEITALCLAGQEEMALLSREDKPFASVLGRVLAFPGKLVTTESKKLHRYGYYHDINIQNVDFDVELAGYLLSPTSTEYTIRRLADEYQVAPFSCTELPEEWQALGGDGLRLIPLWERLSAQIVEHGQDSLLRDIEIPLAQVLADMECIGVELDVPGLIAFGQGLDVDIARLQASIYAHAGEEFNINSTKQLGAILFDKLGLPTRKKTKSGYSTNADVLESLRGKHPIIEDILEYRKLTKLKSTYVDGLLKVVGEDGRIHTSFQQTETRTGRISSIEPNMQNIPVRTEIGSNLRKFFRAGDGEMLVDADYSQIELRVLAHIAQDKNMIDAFLHGADIHTATASQVFNLPPLYVTPLMRSRAKAVNFGIVYGIGAFSLSQDIGVSVAEADKYIKDYLRTYSGVKQYMEDTIAFGKEHGYVQTLFGRRRYLPELTASNHNLKAFGERVAMNTPIQGTAADIIKIAMVRVHRRLAAEGMKSRLVLQIHDELIVESPVEENEKAAAILREEMEGAVQLSVPMSVEAKVGKTWFEAK